MCISGEGERPLLKGGNKPVKRPDCIFKKCALGCVFGHLRGPPSFFKLCVSKLLTVPHKSFQEFHLDCAAYPNDI